ncbi:fructose-2,6-bisphosphatase [Planoprotostelium fungivorum]|uniref:Fructose-2,6-bisphosphatase n=1 Tax=Planoprotostelium fungivorum TaxID=1890364 RepID=A0A2P6ND12_9EUKA|nr:fructose-2,6-bisphosphatase [Planoprotostelium fungivorum]
MKRVYFIRHGQSFYNAAALKGYDPMIPDAELTDLGKRQATELSQQVESLPDIDLIVCSPLSRAIQTTFIAFDKRIAFTPLIILPDIRERVTGCDDLGSTPSELTNKFPSVSFDHLQNIWWYTNGPPEETDPNASKERFIAKPFQEPHDMFLSRVEDFRLWMAKRKERCVVVVGHCDFICQVVGFDLKNCQLVCTLFDPETKQFTVQNKSSL